MRVCLRCSGSTARLGHRFAYRMEVRRLCVGGACADMASQDRVSGEKMDEKIHTYNKKHKRHHIYVFSGGFEVLDRPCCKCSAGMHSALIVQGHFPGSPLWCCGLWQVHQTSNVGCAESRHSPRKLTLQTYPSVYFGVIMAHSCRVNRKGRFQT